MIIVIDFLFFSTPQAKSFMLFRSKIQFPFDFVHYFRTYNIFIMISIPKKNALRFPYLKCFRLRFPSRYLFFNAESNAILRNENTAAEAAVHLQLFPLVSSASHFS